MRLQCGESGVLQSLIVHDWFMTISVQKQKTHRVSSCRTFQPMWHLCTWDTRPRHCWGR